MEINRPRKSIGFRMAKIMPFCKAEKPPSPSPSPSHEYYNNVYYTSSTTTSYAPQPDYNNYVTPLPPKVSFLLQPAASPESKDILRGINSSVEESVDARAASYISSVRERFKLDHCERVTTTIIGLDDEDVEN